MSGNAGYTKPVHMLLASTTRVAEQIKGRVLFVHTECARLQVAGRSSHQQHVEKQNAYRDTRTGSEDEAHRVVGVSFGVQAVRVQTAATGYDRRRRCLLSVMPDVRPSSLVWVIVERSPCATHSAK